MPTQTSQYAKTINFGKKTNQNIDRTADPQNPLTTCLYPDLSNQFLHGSTAANLNPDCKECQNYMADRCSGVYNNKNTWDQYCQAYMMVNNNVNHPNLAAVNVRNSYIMPQYREHRSVGENLLRNSLERKYIAYPGCSLQMEQFDPNIPNSPYYRRSCGCCMASPVVKYINPETIDNEPLMNAALNNFSSCADVLAVIWNAWKSGNLNISNTRLEKHLQQYNQQYAEIMQRIQQDNSAMMSRIPRMQTPIVDQCGK